MSLITTATAPPQTMPSAHTAESPLLIRGFVIPIMAGLFIRLGVAFVWLGTTQPYNDAADYFAEASHLAEGTRESVAFYWPPGTSYYLAGWFRLLGSSITVARVAMIGISVMQIAVVGLLAFHATGSRRIACLACWIWALYPPSVLLVFQPFSQHLAGLSLAVIALCGMQWLRYSSYLWLTLMGLSLGIGCLTRPSMMSVALLAGLGLILSTLAQTGLTWKGVRTVSARCLTLCLPALLVVAPTVAYNAHCGAGYTLSTNNERNFFLGNNPHTPWYKTGLFAQRSLNELPDDVQNYLLSFYNAPNRRAAMTQAAAEHIRKNPGLTALRTANRARAFWGFDYLASRVVLATTGSRIASATVLLAEAAGYCAVMMLALLGLVFWRQQRNWLAVVWCLGAIIAYAAPYCLAFSGGTYHFPVMGLVVPFAALGIEVLLLTDFNRLLSSRRLWTALLLFVALQVEYVYFTIAAGISKSPELERRQSESLPATVPDQTRG